MLQASVLPRDPDAVTDHLLAKGVSGNSCSKAARGTVVAVGQAIVVCGLSFPRKTAGNKNDRLPCRLPIATVVSWKPQARGEWRSVFERIQLGRNSEAGRWLRRRSREITGVRSRKTTQAPTRGGDDNALPVCRLRVKARTFRVVTLFNHRVAILGERRGVLPAPGFSLQIPALQIPAGPRASGAPSARKQRLDFGRNHPWREAGTRGTSHQGAKILSRYCLPHR